MSLPQKLKNNQYIDPKNSQYIKSNDIEGTKHYYIFSWQLIINKEYKLKYDIMNNITYQCTKIKNAENIYILPFYKDYYFQISNLTKLISVYNKNNEIYYTNLKRKKLILDIYKIIHSMVEIDEKKFNNYFVDWINKVNAIELIFKLT